MIEVRNVNDALPLALDLLDRVGVLEGSRNGSVLRVPYPVTIAYKRPWERVLFSSVRDANPYFHLFESLWMLAGRNDLGWIQQFNSRMHEFSDDGMHLHGAYGYRWRQWFDFDQLKIMIEHLRDNPSSRRAVLQMWSPLGDMVGLNGVGGLQAKDVPCNVTVLFAMNGGAIDMTVFNRSNDAIWGAFGANAVHMSVLQDYVASALCVPMGMYYQISNNLHVYVDRFDSDLRARLCQGDDRYTNGLVQCCPLLYAGEGMEQWDSDLSIFMSVGGGESGVFSTRFFGGVISPMWRSWCARKQKMNDGREDASRILADDWRIACLEWIDRREQKRMVNQCSE